MPYLHRGQHQIYYELWGQPDAQSTVLFIHGGPGIGCSEKDKELFDKRKHQVLFVDQRGCGRSRCEAVLQDNRTDLLIQDYIEILNLCELAHVEIFGGSWGSTLGLAFAKMHPSRCTALILRGYFPGTKSFVIEQLSPDYYQSRYPELSALITEHLGESPRENLEKLHEALCQRKSPDPALAALWHSMMSSLALAPDRATIYAKSEMTSAKLRAASLQLHYAHHGFFLPPEHEDHNLDCLNTLSIDLVHGSLDLCCPIQVSRSLKQKIPLLQLHEVDGNHSPHHPALREKLRSLLR